MWVILYTVRHHPRKACDTAYGCLVADTVYSAHWLKLSLGAHYIIAACSRFWKIISSFVQEIVQNSLHPDIGRQPPLSKFPNQA